MDGCVACLVYDSTQPREKGSARSLLIRKLVPTSFENFPKWSSFFLQILVCFNNFNLVEAGPSREPGSYIYCRISSCRL